MKKRVKKKSSSIESGKKILKKDSTALGISGFTLAIVGITTILLHPFISSVALIVALVFCIVQFRKNKTRIGKAGLILSIIGILLNIAWWIILIHYIVPALT